MDYEDIEGIVQRQLMLDIGCKENAEGIYRVTMNKRPERMSEGRRIYGEGGDFFRLIVYGDDAYILSDGAIYDWSRDHFGNMVPRHMMNFHNLRALDKELIKSGYMILELQECYLPGRELFSEDEGLHKATAIAELGEDEKKEMAGSGSFRHAIVSLGKSLTAFAICNEKTGEKVAAAGAQRDGKYLWQIGVDVKPEFRGRSYATALVRYLTRVLLQRGNLPFYGVRPGNIISKRVAEAAGYEAAFSEIHICRTA